MLNYQRIYTISTQQSTVTDGHSHEHMIWETFRRDFSCSFLLESASRHHCFGTSPYHREPVAPRLGFESDGSVVAIVKLYMNNWLVVHGTMEFYDFHMLRVSINGVLI